MSKNKIGRSEPRGPIPGTGSGMARVQQPGGDHGLAHALGRLSTSRTNLYVGLACDCAVGLGLLAAGMHYGGLHPGGALLTVGSGLLAFSFMEYATHRWIFHGPPSPLQAGHRRHHIDPTGFDALPFFLPPLVMGALAGLFGAVLAPGHAMLLAGTIATAYAAYGISHTVLHLYEFNGHPLLHRWWDFHRMHHGHANKNFGVTTGLWDVLLGTRYRPPHHP